MSLAEKLKTQQKNKLASLIDWYGTQAMMAKRLGVSKQTVSNWVARGRISAKAAIKAESDTNKDFTKECLRPDVLDWRK